MYKRLLILVTTLLFGSIIMINQAFSYDVEAVKIYNEGIDLNYQERYDEALSYFERAVEIDPTFLDAYRTLAATNEQLGNLDEAIKNYEILFEKNPQDFETAYKLASLHGENSNNTKAAFYLRKIPHDNSRYKDAQSLAQGLGIEMTVVPPQIKQPTVSAKINTNSKISGKIVANGLEGPAGVAKDSKGNIYVANFGDDSIVQITPKGTKRTIFKGTPLNGPLGLAIDIYDNIYVANYSTNEILKISLKTNTIKTICKDMRKPYSLLVDSSGYLYVTEQGSDSLLKFKVF